MNENRCIKCGSCLRACPVLNDPTGRTFPGPRTTGVDAPRFPERLSMGTAALMCTMCHACEWACPSSLPLTRSMLLTREEMSKAVPPLEGHQRMRESVRHTGRTVDTDFREWREEGAKVLYFPGCIGLGRLPDMVRDTSRLLDELGIEHDISSKALCCGSPLLKVGALEEAEMLHRHNAEVLSSYETIITSCPGCTYHLREVYGVRVSHVVELLEGKELRSEAEGVWALQVPCHLKRGVGPWAAEGMVNALEGAGTRLSRIPDEDSCCGGGGGMLSGFPGIASSIARSKATSYRRAAVSGVITACPFCALSLRRQGLTVLDISQAIRPRR
ncbi:MAG: 4Fe-4S binding protein [Methanomassiliicoccales archaeon]|nr:4Fe-4S binding protein [Methanomassiliicoccales archaeon]